MADFCHVWLTCKDEKEADKITDTLLVKQLVNCARKIPTQSGYRWRGKIEQADEVLLMMESRVDLFEKIETEVAKLHSYDTFVLQATPVAKLSLSTKKWMDDELIDD